MTYPQRKARATRQLAADLRRASKGELLAAVMELAARAYEATEETRQTKVNDPRQAFDCLRDLARRKTEALSVLYLDAGNGLVAQETVSVGSLNTTRTHPREILRPACIHGALGIILGHNHPSGALDPSAEDIEFTRSVTRAAEIMGVEVYDHIIVTRDGYTSLRERGLL